MRRKASVLRLSPNEEAQLVREELESRRKLRLQQVREQERFIARQVRLQVQERRQQQIQTLAESLRMEWQQQHQLKLQALSSLYQHSLTSVGHGHRSARENEPDLEALAQKSVERQDRAEERHRDALRELSARRHEEEQQRGRHIEARRKALAEEKKRAERVASLPPPPPNPVESIGKTTPHPLKSSSAAERFSVTHCHMPHVDRETHPEQQLSAHQAAALQTQRSEELRREEARDQQERLEKARLRGNHALRREQHAQDRARMLCELERLHQADLLRRRQAVLSVPAQIFQPLYRQEELRDGRQRDLEIAFQDACAEERRVKGDVVLQLVPEPLPPSSMSAASHDDELDVTLDPECAPEGEEPDSPLTEPPDPGRRALRRLLDRIRSQRESQRESQRAAAATLTSHEASSVETGSLSSRERAPEGSLEEQTPSPTHTDDGPDVSDEAVVAGTLQPPEEREQPKSESRAAHEEALSRRQQEQLSVLEELEEKRRELEQRLREMKKDTLRDAAQGHAGIQESAGLPEPPPEVDPDDLHTQRLHQYQQRLLQQNRLHQKSVEEARRRLQEYQHTLKLRYALGSTTAARATLPQPSGSSETISEGTRSALPLTLNLHPGKDPAGQPPAHPVQSLPKPAGSDWSLSEGASAEEGAPLPPPAVVLELLLSRLHPEPQPADTGSLTAPAGPVQREEEADGPQELMRNMRRQRDALQALITADTQASVSSGPQADHMTVDSSLSAIGEANGHSRRPAATAALSHECVCGPAPVNRGRVKPPVSRPPARLAFSQQMEQHELSAIQEVDTPANTSLDTGTPADLSHHHPAGVCDLSHHHPAGVCDLQSSSEVSESSSVSLPALTSDGSHSPGQRSQVTGRISRLSWREMLLQDSGLSSLKHQQERFGAGRPSSDDPDYLSSTTISTGSYLTSDPEPGDSHLCVEPDVCGPSQELRASVQQIIDKYSQELDASLRHAGAVDSSSVCPSWSSVLQEEGQETSSSSLSSGGFLPLQPHPDIDSSSSSSSRNVVRDDQSRQAQGWSETVNRILDRLSDQLTIRLGEQEHGPDPDGSSQASGVTSGPGHISGHSGSSAELQDRAASRERCVLIGRASDIGSSQVFDQSSALALSTAAVSDGDGSDGSSRSPAPQLSDEDRRAFTDAPHGECDDASDWFLPLPSDVTNNESVDRSTALCVPLEAEQCGVSGCVDEASDWLDSTDQSLQPLRSDPQDQPDLQVSMEQLWLTHEPLCEADAVEVSPLRTGLQEESLTPAAQFPSQEVTSAPPPLQPAVERNALSELLERAQAAGDVKGILEESTISFISLPESTQDPDLSEEPQEVTEEPQEVTGKAQTDDSQSEEPEPSFPHAVMLLEFQCSPAQRQRREALGQRSALRAAQVKARHGPARLEQHETRARRADTAERLKTVAEVRICSAAQRRVQEKEMHRRTERLYSRLEEVKQQKQIQSRQEAYAKNREKARDFQRKTLEKLRAKLKP